MVDLISVITTMDKSNRGTSTDRWNFSYTKCIFERRSCRKRRKKAIAAVKTSPRMKLTEGMK